MTQFVLLVTQVTSVTNKTENKEESLSYLNMERFFGEKSHQKCHTKYKIAFSK